MPKIVYPICGRIDVHKSFVVACVATTDIQLVTTYKSKRFSTFTGDLRRLAAWFEENHCCNVCMESTGKYWIPVRNILEATCQLVLAHPKYVKSIKSKKTDKREAKWIADIFKHDLLNGSFIPPEDIRQLRLSTLSCKANRKKQKTSGSKKSLSIPKKTTWKQESD